MTTILRLILLFLLAPVFTIVAQAAGAVQNDFRIVDAGFRTQSVNLGTVYAGIFNYDSSGALLQQRRSLNGKAADEDDRSRSLAIEASEAAQPLFSFLAKCVATNKVPTQLEFGFVDDLASRPAINWPPNNGFLESGRASLLPGTRLDRFGTDGGRFLAPQNTPFGARSLPSGAKNSPYSVFEVARPFEVNAGPAAPWFNQQGRGLQFQTDVSVQSLIDDGYLNVIRRAP